MKSLEELAWTSEDLPSLLTKVILAEVEEAARARRFGRNLVRINEDLVRTKGRSIIFYRRGILTAESVSEGGQMTGSTITYTPHTLTVGKYGCAALITQEAIDGSNLDLIRDTIREAGIALADKEDLVILQALMGEEATMTKNTLEFPSGGETVSLSTFPVTYIEVPSGTIVTVDYFNGKVTSPNAGTFDVSFFWSDRENKVDAATEGTFAYEDIVTAANVVRGNKWSPDFMLIHPDQMAQLLKSPQFIDASKYGAREPLLRGEIGQISGLRVLVSTNMRSGNAIILASKRAGWLAIKRHVDLKRWDNPQTDSIELYFYMEYGAKVTDEAAIVLLVGLGPVAGTPV